MREDLKKEFIKNNYGNMSCQNIMKELHISYNTLIKYAKELDIYKPKEEVIVFDKEKLDFIDKNYEKMGAQKIADYYSCSEQVIYKYAKKLNKTKACILWSDEEITLIKKHYRCSTLRQMQRILKENGYIRTLKAIEGKAKSLKIYKDPSFGGEYLLSKDIIEIMNFSKGKLNKLFLNDKIQCKIHKRKRIVTIEQFIEYLKNHTDTWNCRRVDLDYIKMICSTENITINKINQNNFDNLKIPNWLKEKIKEDFSKQLKEKKPWTTKEVLEVLNYKREGFSYSEISKKVNRSYNSVYDKISEFI